MEAGLTIRSLGPGDRDLWCGLYAEVFPKAEKTGVFAEIDRILAAPHRHGFVAHVGGVAAGFAETSLREFANGCVSKPVPFLEGIWVQEDYRRRGIARALVAHVEQIYRDQGFREMGSDVAQSNAAGQAFHGKLAFAETERVIYFRKWL